MAKRKKKAKKADPVVGQGIVEFRRSTAAEQNMYDWPPFDVIELKNGNRLIVYGDDEGNMPGYFGLHARVEGRWKNVGELDESNSAVLKAAEISMLQPLGYTFQAMLRPGKSVEKMMDVSGIALAPMPGISSHQRWGLLSYIDKSGKTYSLTQMPAMSPREMADRGLI